MSGQIRRFTAREFARFSDEQADKYGRFIESKLGDGPYTDDDLVRISKPKRAATHEWVFNVDDAEAALEYRRERARELSRSLIRVEVLDSGEEVKTRAFHHVQVTQAEGDVVPGYVASTVVWRTPDLAQQVVEKAHRELQSWTNRYRQYEELAKLVVEVEDLLLAA